MSYRQVSCRNILHLLSSDNYYPSRTSLISSSIIKDSIFCWCCRWVFFSYKYRFFTCEVPCVGGLWGVWLQIKINQVGCWWRKIPGIRFQFCVLIWRHWGGDMWCCHWCCGSSERIFVFSPYLYITRWCLVQVGLEVLGPIPLNFGGYSLFLKYWAQSRRFHIMVLSSRRGCGNQGVLQRFFHCSLKILPCFWFSYLPITHSILPCCG